MTGTHIVVEGLTKTFRVAERRSGAMGAVAGLMGGLLASAFSRILLTRVLDAKFELDVRAILISVALTAILANAAGWFASVRILRQKPLEVLREE